jgi:hypothetical protein
MKKITLAQIKKAKRAGFPDINRGRAGKRVMEGEIVAVSADFGGRVTLKKVKSEDEFVVQLKNILWIE